MRRLHSSLPLFIQLPAPLTPPSPSLPCPFHSALPPPPFPSCTHVGVGGQVGCLQPIHQHAPTGPLQGTEQAEPIGTPGAGVAQQPLVSAGRGPGSGRGPGQGGGVDSGRGGSAAAGA